MLKLIGNKIQMVKGDFGLPLPIPIPEQNIASDEEIKFIVEESNGKEILTKKYSNITNNQFELSFTKEESERLKAKTYLYKIDWYKEDVFKGNIVRDEIFEVLGNNDECEEEEIVLNLQTKTVIPTKEQQSITYDEEYDALGEVIVEPIPNEYIKPTGTLEITTNGKYDVTEKAEVDVNVDMELPIIDDASNLFSDGARLNEMEKFLLMCKNVTSAYGMFKGCKNLTKLDLKNFNTSSITSMQSMFDTCENLTEIDISTFDTSKNETMMAMFSGCKKLNEVNVSFFDTSNVKYFTNMFSLCENLTEIDISTFDTSKASSTNGIFNYCKNLKKVIINNHSVFKMTNTTMLGNTPIASGTGYIYVPDDLIETYKTSTNWSTYASQIKGISELEATE